MRVRFFHLAPLYCTLFVALLIVSTASAQSSDQDVLTDAEWQQVDRSVERALAWLARTQNPDGSFMTVPQGQPGVTSLCTMAFLSHGHLPGEESQYGQVLENAINYVISCQKPNGLVANVAPRGVRVTRAVSHEIGVSAVYNHTIASLLLSEVYGIAGAQQIDQLQPIVEKSLEVSLEMQAWPTAREIDRGGWRYLHPYKQVHADLSLTGWQLMFLRSAKNAGFDVPASSIEDAVGYVRRCFDPRYGVFTYTVDDGDSRSRAMAGAGVLAFAHAGLHHSEEARRSGDWILKHNFDRYNRTANFSRKYPKDRYHYGVFNCTQAMYQLGGDHWRQFFPRIVRVLVNHQNRDGSWQREKHYEDKIYGNAYSTALVVLALGAPNQFLPVFQR